MTDKRKIMSLVIYTILTNIPMSFGNKWLGKSLSRDEIYTGNSSSDNAALKDKGAVLEILPELSDILDRTRIQPTVLAVLFECFVRNIYGWSLDQLCPIEIDDENFQETLRNMSSEGAEFDLSSSSLPIEEIKVNNEHHSDTNIDSERENPRVVAKKNDSMRHDEIKTKNERTKIFSKRKTNVNSMKVGRNDVLPGIFNITFHTESEQDDMALNSESLEDGKEIKRKEPQSEERFRIRQMNNEKKGHQDRSTSPQTVTQNLQTHSLPNVEDKEQIRRDSERQFDVKGEPRVSIQKSPRLHHATKRDIDALPVFRHSKSTSTQSSLPTQPPDDLYLQVPDLIRHYGYPAEVHDIRTSDDYVLTLHRIVGAQKDESAQTITAPTSEQKKSVLLVHGFASSSADFVIGGPDSALGFMLADAGYDVWLGNFRGNSYSKRHTSFSRDQAKYWQFSLDDLARRDVPAMVDHIIKTTDQPNIFYVGHSIGATVLPMTCHIKPDFAQKIRHFSAMAPIGFGKMSRGPVKVMTNLARITYKHKEEGGGAKAQVLSRDRATVAVMFFFCSAHSLFWKLCLTLLTAAGGRNTGLFNKEMLSLVLANFPAGTSVRLAAHVGQLLSSDGLQMFDFGEDRNQELYKQTTPLEYDLKNTRCPTAVYWAFNDYLAPPEDVKIMISSLPNVTEKMLVGHETFNHFDFVYSNQARHLVHTGLIKTMGKYA